MNAIFFLDLPPGSRDPRSPQKVFQEFKASLDAAESVSLKDLITYKRDIEIEYPGTRSNTWIGRIADAMWRGGTIDAKEAALDATYQKLDALFFGEGGSYGEDKTNEATRTQYRQKLDAIYNELMSPTPNIENLNNLIAKHDGAWLTRFAKLGYPGAQFILAEALSDPDKAIKLALDVDQKQALAYAEQWLQFLVQSKDNADPDPTLLWRGLSIVPQTKEADSLTQQLLTRIIFSDADQALKAEAYLMRGTQKLGPSNPEDQLLGYKDLIQAVELASIAAIDVIHDLEIDVLKNGHLFPSDTWGREFVQKHLDEIIELNSQIWAYATTNNEHKAEALRLRGLLLSDGPQLELQLSGWQSLIQAADLGDTEAIQTIQQREMDALTEGNLYPTANWPIDFLKANRAEIEQLDRQIWHYTTLHHHTEETSLRAALQTQSPIDEDKMIGWTDLVTMAELGSPHAKRTISQQATEALKHDSTPFPTVSANHAPAPVESYVRANQARIDRVNAKLWIIAANQEEDQEQKVLRLEQAARLGSLEALRQIAPFLEEPDFFITSLKTILNKEEAGSTEHEAALAAFHNLAIDMAGFDPKTGAEHLLFLSQLGHYPSKRALAEIGLEKDPEFKNYLSNQLSIPECDCVIGYMLYQGIVLGEDQPRGLEFLNRLQSEVPAAAFLAAQIRLEEDDSQKAIQLLTPIIVQYPADSGLGRDARDV